jgi:hypothetical protein
VRRTVCFAGPAIAIETAKPEPNTATSNTFAATLFKPTPLLELERLRPLRRVDGREVAGRVAG